MRKVRNISEHAHIEKNPGEKHQSLLFTHLDYDKSYQGKKH